MRNPVLLLLALSLVPSGCVVPEVGGGSSDPVREPLPVETGPACSSGWAELEGLTRERASERVDAGGRPGSEGEWYVFRALGSGDRKEDARAAAYGAARGSAVQARETDVVALTESVSTLEQRGETWSEYGRLLNEVLTSSRGTQVEVEEGRWEWSGSSGRGFEVVAEVRVPLERVHPERAIRELAGADLDPQVVGRRLALMASGARAVGDERVELAALFARYRVLGDRSSCAELGARLEALRGAGEALELLELRRERDGAWAQEQIDALLDRQQDFQALVDRLLRAVQRSDGPQTSVLHENLGQGREQTIEIFGRPQAPYACIWIDEDGLFVPGGEFQGRCDAKGRVTLAVSHGGTRGRVRLVVLLAGEGREDALSFLAAVPSTGLRERDCRALTPASLALRRELRNFVESLQTELDSARTTATQVTWEQD